MTPSIHNSPVSSLHASVPTPRKRAWKTGIRMLTALMGSNRVPDVWDEWRGSLDGRPTMWVKHLWCHRGYHIDLHRMIQADDPACFHTHPAYAIRIILRGGYLEEMENGRQRCWWPGRIGFVAPTLCHRIAGLRTDQDSCSLWIRFRKRAPIALRGQGWATQSPAGQVPPIRDAPTSPDM